MLGKKSGKKLAEKIRRELNEYLHRSNKSLNAQRDQKLKSFEKKYAKDNKHKTVIAAVLNDWLEENGNKFTHKADLDALQKLQEDKFFIEPDFYLQEVEDEYPDEITAIQLLKDELELYAAIPDKNKSREDMGREAKICEKLAENYSKIYSPLSKKEPQADGDKKILSVLKRKIIALNKRKANLLALEDANQPMLFMDGESFSEKKNQSDANLLNALKVWQEKNSAEANELNLTGLIRALETADKLKLRADWNLEKIGLEELEKIEHFKEFHGTLSARKDLAERNLERIAQLQVKNDRLKQPSVEVMLSKPGKYLLKEARAESRRLYRKPESKHQETNKSFMKDMEECFYVYKKPLGLFRYKKEFFDPQKFLKLMDSLFDSINEHEEFLFPEKYSDENKRNNPALENDVFRQGLLSAARKLSNKQILTLYKYLNTANAKNFFAAVALYKNSPDQITGKMLNIEASENIDSVVSKSAQSVAGGFFEKYMSLPAVLGEVIKQRGLMPEEKAIYDSGSITSIKNVKPVNQSFLLEKFKETALIKIKEAEKLEKDRKIVGNKM